MTAIRYFLLSGGKLTFISSGRIRFSETIHLMYGHYVWVISDEYDLVKNL